MAARRGGLGRGLESLIPGIGADDAASGSLLIDVGALEPNPHQPRVRWDAEQLEALAGSIREHGIIQPIVVTRATGDVPYQIIAGERRWRAAQLAGIDFDSREAHSAVYDAERTADLFCHVCNGMHESFVRAEEKARALGWKDGAPAPLDLSED